VCSVSIAKISRIVIIGLIYFRQANNKTPFFKSKVLPYLWWEFSDNTNCTYVCMWAMSKLLSHQTSSSLTHFPIFVALIAHYIGVGLAFIDITYLHTFICRHLSRFQHRLNLQKLLVHMLDRSLLFLKTIHSFKQVSKFQKVFTSFKKFLQVSKRFYTFQKVFTSLKTFLQVSNSFHKFSFSLLEDCLSHNLPYKQFSLISTTNLGQTKKLAN
jgi:hypothetical protein